MYPDPNDPTYLARLEISGQKERMQELQRAAKTATKKGTLEALFNALCACEARVAELTLTYF